MIGKEIRLCKLIQPDTNRTCMVPLDHAATVGPIHGLENPVSTIDNIGVEKANAFIIHKGVFYQLEGEKRLLAGGNYILHLSASTNRGELTVSKNLISSVEQAVILGAVGVSVHVNIGNGYESHMLTDLGMTADACYRWGMPLLAMMYVRNDTDENCNDKKRIAHAARIAQEMGADIVKIACPRQIKDLYDIVDKVQIPVIISGGEKMEDLQFLSYVNEALKMGISGVSTGRNIFQSDTPHQLVAFVSDLVHKRKSFDEIKKEWMIDENADY